MGNQNKLGLKELDCSFSISPAISPARPSWSSTKEESRPEVIYGAVQTGLHDSYSSDTETWELLTDPVEFATAEGAVVPGASVEEILKALDRRLGGDGMIRWYEASGGFHPNRNQSRFTLRCHPAVKKGADPFKAAKSVPGTCLTTVGPLPVPAGVTVFHDNDGWLNNTQAQWVWNGFAYKQSQQGHSGVLTYGLEAVAEAEKEMKTGRQRVRRRATRKKRQAGYTTLPGSKARVAYQTAVQALAQALHVSLGNSVGGVIIRKRGNLKAHKRSQILQWTLDVLTQAKTAGQTKQTEHVEMTQLRVIFQPLHDNWKIAKTKADAKHVKPILDLLWPPESK